jgi:hypothetical protein
MRHNLNGLSVAAAAEHIYYSARGTLDTLAENALINSAFLVG